MSKRSVGSRPRVAIDLHSLDSIYQGSRTYCFEIFSRLIRRLPEIDFVLFADTGRWKKSNEQTFAAPHVQIVHMPHTNSIRRLALQMPALARQHRIDLLHTQYISPVVLAARTAVTVHDVLFEDYPEYFGTVMRLRSKILYRLSAKRSDLLFTVSDYSRQTIASHYHIPIQKIVKTPNGVDMRCFFPGSVGHAAVEALGIQPGKYLLTVGRLEPRKNHIGLLKAFSLLSSPRPKLVIVGQEDFGFEHIYAAVGELGLRQDILFIKSADTALLVALYRHACLFVYPTFAEGFGIPVLEAMASGVPVITSNTTALPEVSGGAALVVDPTAPAEILRGMRSILSDPQLAARMVQNGLGQAQKFSWDASVSAVEDAYRAYFTLAPRA